MARSSCTLRERTKKLSDYLRDDHTETNSVYVRHLLPLMGKAELSLVDVAKRVQVQVDEDARSNSRTQRPAYFDGIIGQSYLHRLEREGKPLEPTERIVADNAIRLAAFATWDSNCQSRPPPRVKVSATPKYGRILTRSETVVVDTTQFGNACGQIDSKSNRRILLHRRCGQKMERLSRKWRWLSSTGPSCRRRS